VQYPKLAFAVFVVLPLPAVALAGLSLVPLWSTRTFLPSLPALASAFHSIEIVFIIPTNTVVDLLAAGAVEHLAVTLIPVPIIAAMATSNSTSVNVEGRLTMAMDVWQQLVEESEVG
jgi:hypothetical protein